LLQSENAICGISEQAHQQMQRPRVYQMKSKANQLTFTSGS